ncbi:MAG: ammonium transporter, partial [Prevotella sp.]|nr:ammonium transporter [Prevotella sp.]
SHVFLTTNLAAAAGGIATMFVTWMKYKKPSLSLMLNGVLAGLVGITAGCDLVSPVGAVIIGLVCGIILPFAIEFIDQKLHIDDPVGASSVHGVCGIIGTLMVGLFSVDNGLLYGHGFGFLGAQAFGIVCIDIWAAATGCILFFGLKKIKGIRVDRRIEEEGLDIYEHGESCFNR